MGYIRWCAYAPCGKVMIVRKSLLERKKYCSKDCQNKAKIGRSCSPATQFKKGNVPPTLVPVGTESMSKGYMRVKVAEPNVWRQRSHIAWEEANRKPLPDGWIVRHVDGDPLNDEPGNLVALSRGQHLKIILEDPEVGAKMQKLKNKATKKRWDAYREKKMEKYDTYYWEDG